MLTFSGGAGEGRFRSRGCQASQSSASLATDSGLRPDSSQPAMLEALVARGRDSPGPPDMTRPATVSMQVVRSFTVHGACGRSFAADRAVAGGSVEVSGGLQGEELCVVAFKAHELGVGALLGQPALVEQEDAVGLPDRGEAVRDENGGAPLGERAQPGEQLVFGLGVEREVGSSRTSIGAARMNDLARTTFCH